MSIDVGGVDHIYVAVSNLARAEAFYDAVMRFLGFKKGVFPIAGERHLHYFNRVTQYSIRPARSSEAHDPYRPGLHHLCFRVADRAQVDEAARGLVSLGVAASAPKIYTEYADDYYATFFTDPDGIRLEIVALRKGRIIVRDHWEKLTEFEDPVRKAGL
jgi:catechol 2,3-dioxygenase-like lactoylglutathione lyase family enzyme